jgi:hypothetical protein
MHQLLWGIAWASRRMISFLCWPQTSYDSINQESVYVRGKILYCRAWKGMRYILGLRSHLPTLLTFQSQKWVCTSPEEAVPCASRSKTNWTKR